MLALEARPSRNVESPAPLTEVGSDFVSRDKANVVPVGSGTNFKAVASAASRGTAAKDKEQAKYFHVELAPKSARSALRADFRAALHTRLGDDPLFLLGVLVVEWVLTLNKTAPWLV